MDDEATEPENRQRNGIYSSTAPPSFDSTLPNSLHGDWNETSAILRRPTNVPFEDCGFKSSESINASQDSCGNDSEHLINPSSEDTSRSWYECITVEPIIFLLNVAMTLANPVQTDLFLGHTCRGVLGYNETTCDVLEGATSQALETLVQPQASVYIMWSRLIETCVPAILTLFVGPWSDTHGRKLFLVLPIVGFFLKYVAYFVSSFYPALSPSFLLIASVPVSLSGGLVSFVSLYYCYISDVSSELRRGFRMGMLEACTYCGMLLGTAASPHLFSAGGYVAVFAASAALCAVTFLYSVLFLNESVSNADSCRGLSSLFNCGLVKDVVLTCCKNRGYGRRAIIFLIVVALSTSVLAMEGESAVTFLFTREKFNWNIQRFTTYWSVYIAMQMMGTVIGVSVLSAWLGIGDTPLSVMAYFLKGASSVILAMSPEPWYLHLAAAVGSFGAVAGPLCPAILSRTVDQQDVGKVFSLLTAAEAVTPLMAAPLYTLLYTATLDHFPGAIFFLSAGLGMLDFFMILCVWVIQSRNPVSSDPLLAS